MPRKLIKRYLPSKKKIRELKHLRLVSHLFDDPLLWHLHRYNVAKACALGLFICFIPIPGQMLLAASFAIILRLNLPVSVVMVWFTNPLTMPALFYLAFKVGAFVLNIEPGFDSFSIFDFSFWKKQMSLIWVPFLLGCVICGASLSFLGYWVSRIFWHAWVCYKWRKRRLSRLAR